MQCLNSLDFVMILMARPLILLGMLVKYEKLKLPAL